MIKKKKKEKKLTFSRKKNSGKKAVNLSLSLMKQGRLSLCKLPGEQPSQFLRVSLIKGWSALVPELLRVQFYLLKNVNWVWIFIRDLHAHGLKSNGLKAPALLPSPLISCSQTNFQVLKLSLWRSPSSLRRCLHVFILGIIYWLSLIRWEFNSFSYTPLLLDSSFFHPLIYLYGNVG